MWQRSNERTWQNRIAFKYVSLYYIWCSHSGRYEEFCLLGYNPVSSVERQLTVRRNISPLSSGSMDNFLFFFNKVPLKMQRTICENWFFSIWLYNSLGLGCFFSFLILGRGISPSQGRYMHRINAHRHPCLEWDSNPRPQCSNGRRHTLDHADTVIGTDLFKGLKLIRRNSFWHCFLSGLGIVSIRNSEEY
jgi:hypothetical protein